MPPLGGTTFVLRTMESVSVGHADTQLPQPMQWSSFTQIISSKHPQGFHGTSFQAITAPRTGCFINGYLEIGVSQCRLIIEFLYHLQELAAAAATITNKYKITCKIVRVVNQPGLFGGFQNPVTFFPGNAISEFPLHHVVGYIPEG